MNSTGPLHPEIAKALDNGAAIVTGNQRAARTLMRAFDLRNRQLGLGSWQPAQVFSWDTWTSTLWRRLLIDGHVSRLLVNRTQEHSIWLGILATDNELKSLRSKDALATLAADAWQRLCSYCGQSKLRGTASTPDTMAFERWAIEFHRKCRDGNFLAQAELEDALTRAATTNDLRLEQTEIALLGFDRFTPAQSALLKAIQSAGCNVSELQPTFPTEKRLLIKAADEEDEIVTAARWARQLLKERPETQIAIVVPSLEKHRAQMDRTFRGILAPELQNIAASEDTCPYEFSLGTPLAQTPMVRTALDLLHLAIGPISVDRASALVLSPYFSMEPAERAARAEFDVFEMRKAHRLRPEILLDWLSTATYKSPRRKNLRRLSSALQALHPLSLRLSKPQQKTHAEWAQTMHELLDIARWRSEHETSIEFQIRRKWESALDELAALDFDGSRVEFSHALKSLERIVEQNMFAPESHEAPIQIIGALEAAGATFDAIWLMRAGDLSWPLPTSTNPLLSWRLQRELQMPGSDVARDSSDAHKLTERIVASATTAIVSYATETPEGKQQHSSSLEGLGLSEIDTGDIAAPEAPYALVELELLNDDEPIQPLPDAIVHGGAQVLKSQAKCPFRAFAEHRLRSSKIEQSVPGMSAAESGIAVHRALELFWSEVRTQQRLKEMPSRELAEMVDRCVLRSLAKMDSLSGTAWDTAYMQVQRARMNRLLIHWLELEIKRPSFEVVAQEEGLSDVHVGPLRLKVRVDRVDSTKDGRILIDYKTGKVTPNEWLTDRPDEPQLPLYAIVTDATKLQGVAFGLVRAGDDRDLTGFGAATDVILHQRKLKFASLENQVEDWRRVLDNLAVNFSQGDASVDPKAYPKTCQHCSQRILCRLDPSQLQKEDDEVEVELG
ncbi:ATP-dependent helicase [Edaphobacter acidisoli]|uniref:ATP-dependent helicase n=1 Tax=Edaphobacter acidisoli TaxID=2040573 RepID=A0A916RM79_9BACT|nr:PD-(D/E)XK nuclease family protein [Edaphobacter acidisoli]GGA60454.1 ATP-dependent helicase [Edaphobacter acidisoli]